MAGSTLGKRQETVGARSSCLLPWLPSPLFKPLACGSKALGAGTDVGWISQLTFMRESIPEMAKENETREGKGESWMARQKEVVLWDWGKEMLKESEKSI